MIWNAGSKSKSKSNAQAMECPSMATRATYEFKPDHKTFYIHNSGHPTGAAVYFAAMLSVNDRVYQTNASKFAEGNLCAEPTGSHEAHGDTDYRYTLDGATLVANRRVLWLQHEEWQTFFVGSVDEFIASYPPPS